MRVRREKLGLNPKEVALAVGVRYDTVCAWEREQFYPTAANYDRWEAFIDQLERDRLAELLERHWLRG